MINEINFSKLESRKKSIQITDSVISPKKVNLFNILYLKLSEEIPEKISAEIRRVFIKVFLDKVVSVIINIINTSNKRLFLF